jgi:4'-phosphopantetheinyl transferase
MMTDAPASRVTAWACFSDTRELTETRITELTGCLSADERARAARFWHANDRRDYVAAHALVRMALSAQTQLAPEHLRFGADSYGKPFLRLPDGETPPTFSLAHSRGLVACALASEGAVGIDVEHVDASIDATRLATDLFSAGEVEALQRCSIAERPSRFCELWTLKEALFKAVGTGLRSELNAVSFRVDGDQVSLTAAAPLFTHVPWEFVLMDVGGTHKLAIAIDARQQDSQQLPITCCDLTRSVPLLLRCDVGDTE